MNRTTRGIATVMGAYAGLLGAVHGIFEALQGSIAPSGIGISAIGAPCQREVVWHACLPAMTIVPSFLWAGVLTIVFATAIVVWAAAFVSGKRGGVILILLSILMLLVGGGIIPPLLGIIGGIAGTRITAPLTFVRTHFSDRTSRVLARLWPWDLIVFLVWSLGGWVLGYVSNQIMMKLGLISLFVFDLGLPVLIVFSGLARDTSIVKRQVPIPRRG